MEFAEIQKSKVDGKIFEVIVKENFKPHYTKNVNTLREACDVINMFRCSWVDASFAATFRVSKPDDGYRIFRASLSVSPNYDDAFAEWSWFSDAKSSLRYIDGTDLSIEEAMRKIAEEEKCNPDTIGAMILLE